MVNSGVYPTLYCIYFQNTNVKKKKDNCVLEMQHSNWVAGNNWRGFLLTGQAKKVFYFTGYTAVVSLFLTWWDKNEIFKILYKKYKLALY